MKAGDIQVLDVKRICSFTDLLVLSTGTVRVHLNAIAAKIVEQLGKRSIRPPAIEGLDSTDWIVLDYGDVVVHIFTNESRRYYNLERLWGDGQPVEWRPKTSRRRKS